jgi:cytochrome c551/c552
MNFNSLANKAKGIFTKRGGTSAAKEDVDELKDIAAKDESLADKAKDAAEAMKDPGAAGEEPRGDAPTPPQTPPPAP